MRMIYDEKLAQAAYLIGCQMTGEAIIIDPERDVDRYIDLAAAHGLRIIATAETHIHADFVSGSRELAERVGAKVYVSDEGDSDWKYAWLDQKIGGGSYDHQLLYDGDTFFIGKIELRVVHTPGHTPEHIVFLITDHGAKATDPLGMATGDFVFVGDLGRPDLLETAAGHAGAMEPSARRLFSTVQKLNGVPDFVQVWPGHGAGSACGKSLGAVPTSTIGYEKRFNAAILAATNEQKFVDYILADQPEPPLYFARMKQVNKTGPAVLGSLPEPVRISLDALMRLDPRSVAIVDTRSWESFRVGHVAGSLCFPLTKSFNTDAGSMVKDSEDMYLVVDEQDLEEAIRDLIRIGLDRIKGWCPACEVSGAKHLASIHEVSAQEALPLVESRRVRTLDVRRKSEFAGGHVPGAINISHTRLAGRMDEVPQGTQLLVNCQGGARSARAAAFLKRAGYDIITLRGGMVAWEKSTAPIER